VVESDVDDEFPEAADIIIASIVAKRYVEKEKIINDHFSHLHATLWLGIEQWRPLSP